MAQGEHRLIGRQEELARLERVLAVPTHHAFAVLRGEAGTGKSALLQMAVALAGEAGLRVVVASGVEAESELPFAGLHQLLLPLLPYGAQLPGASRAVLEQVTGLRAGAAPGVAEVAGAMLSLIAAAADDRQLFFAVDDAHWFDSESARVCTFVMRRAGAVGGRGVITVRADVPSVFDDAGLEEIEVGSLGEEDAAALLERTGGHLDPAARERVLHGAEGNPLALIELPKTAGRVPAAPAGQASPLPLTRRLESLYGNRISELTPSAQESLLLAALDGLSSVAGPRRPALERRLGDVDEAIGRGLLVVDPVSSQLGFRHPLVRSAVVQLATPNRRRAAHAELAALYPDDQERRARHLAEATVDPDEKVAALLEQAAEAATRRGASSVAVSWLERAAQLSERPDQRSRRLAEAAFVAGQSAQLERAQQLSESAGTADTDVIIAECYAALYQDGEVRTTHRKVVAALERLDSLRDKPTAERLINLLLVISLFAADSATWTITESCVDRFCDPADPTGSASLLYRDTWGDVVRRGVGGLERLRRQFVRASSDRPWEAMRLLVGAYYLDALDEFRSLLTRLVAREGEAGAAGNAMTLLQLVMLDHMGAGRWADAEQTGRRGLEMTARHGYALFAHQFRAFLAMVAACRGDSDTADGHRRAVEAWARPRGIGYLTQYADALGMMAALARSDYAIAYRFATNITAPGEFAAHSQQAPRTLLDFVEAAVRSGHLDEGRRHAQAALAAGLPALSPRLALVSAAAQAMAAQEDAPSLYEHALALPGAALFPFETARIRLAYGERLRRDHETRAAREQLEEALRVLTDLGALPWAERAQAELAAAGAAFGARGEGWQSLTVQERQIAQLAATGLTNKEIGAKLFLSPRTVSSHLYRIFPKLGITSRAALRDALDADTRAAPPDGA
ncbi:helix-turn-helix transcriptional regulator [Streptomyces sp. NBC_00271]|uniref:helix-turn-helix transcriptional regulator n=1 Tax=Streptomyces sp. NBC_00271 TaxID=2975697 RepID=UPI002E296E3A|nr:LuxR C-terminal-related transcriptional regulator [Streptomyces sp. NBC_00271]